MDSRHPRCGLTLFMPAWNEEAGIDRSVDAALDAGERLVGDGVVASFEVLVVDDASSDGTPVILEERARRDPRVRVVSHDRNRGLGGAIKTGLASALGEFVLYTDADLPFDLAELDKAFRLLRHHDAHIVSAFRHDRRGEGPQRAAYSFVYNGLVGVVLGLRVRDVNFAAKLIRREVLDSVELRSEGSFIDAELLAKAERRGFRIVQFGVDYFPRSRGVSTLSSLPVIVRIVKEMVTLRPEILSVQPREGPS